MAWTPFLATRTCRRGRPSGIVNLDGVEQERSLYFVSFLYYVGTFYVFVWFRMDDAWGTSEEVYIASEVPVGGWRELRWCGPIVASRCSMEMAIKK